jgi:hypothetical protein
MECVECPYKETILDMKRSHEKDVEKNSEQHKEFYEAITDIKLTQKETQSDVKIVRNEMSTMLGLIKTVQSDTAELKNKPSKKLDAVSISVISGSIMVIAAAVITAIIKLL